MQTQLSATPLSPELQQKYDALATNIQQLGHLAIAFSGGVDSTLLLKVAHDVLGENAVAITARAQMIPAREVQEASDFCNIEHIRHIIMDVDAFAIDGFAENPANRCYVCKTCSAASCKKLPTWGFFTLPKARTLATLATIAPALRRLPSCPLKAPC